MSEAVIAAVLLLHERSVEEIVAKLSAAELEQVIKLVGRSPRVYPPGTLDLLKRRRAMVSPERRESTRSNVSTEKQHAGTRGADPRGRPSARSDAADERRSDIKKTNSHNAERRTTCWLSSDVRGAGVSILRCCLEHALIGS